MYAYFGHHKTATRWIIDILDEVCAATGLTGREYHSVRCFDGDLPAAVRGDGLDFLCYTNVDVEHARRLIDFRGFVGFLGLLGEGRGRIDEGTLRDIVHRHRFEVKAGGRTPGEEDRSSHYRRGQSGDWVNHFEPVHVEAFKERYNDLLLLLGYETDPDWSLPAQSAMTSR